MLGNKPKKWSDIRHDEAIYVLWPSEYKLCSIKSVYDNKVIVETSNGGILEVNDLDSLRIYLNSNLDYDNHINS